MIDEVEQFNLLKPRLPRIYAEFQTDPDYEHTSLIVPSLSVNQEELAKVLGSPLYEERLLFALIRLRNPNARVIYVTSQPVNPDIVDYYLQLLDGVTLSQARQRLKMVSVFDASSRPLTEKILERPRLIARLQAQIDADPGLQGAMAADHRAHIALRDSYLDEGQRRRLEQLGFGEVFRAKGIGGIADFSRIRCLHTWYAAHLVVPNTVGRLLDQHWQIAGGE